MSSSWFGLEDFIVIPSENSSHPPQILSRGLTHRMFITVILSGTVCIIAFSALGVLTNIINIRVFRNMKVKDSVSVSFLNLSVSDLLASLLCLVFGFSLIPFIMELEYGPRYILDPYIIMFVALDLTHMMYTITTLISLYIAIGRCICVVKPFHFKQMFTTRRCWIFIIGCYVFSVVNFIPIFMDFEIVYQMVTPFNISRYVLNFRYGDSPILRVPFTLNQTVLPILAQFICLICVVVMIWGLKKASAFRQSASTVGISQSQLNNRDSTYTLSNDQDENTLENSKNSSGKDFQIMHQIVLLCAIYMICNLPAIMLCLFFIVVPGAGGDPLIHRYARLYVGLQPLRRAIEQVNSSVNIFFYLKYNRKFRDYCSANFFFGKWL